MNTDAGLAAQYRQEIVRQQNISKKRYDVYLKEGTFVSLVRFYGGNICSNYQSENLTEAYLGVPFPQLSAANGRLHFMSESDRRLHAASAISRHRSTAFTLKFEISPQHRHPGAWLDGLYVLLRI